MIAWNPVFFVKLTWDRLCVCIVECADVLISLLFIDFKVTEINLEDSYFGLPKSSTIFSSNKQKSADVFPYPGITGRKWTCKLFAQVDSPNYMSIPREHDDVMPTAEQYLHYLKSLISMVTHASSSKISLPSEIICFRPSGVCYMNVINYDSLGVNTVQWMVPIFGVQPDVSLLL